jgi:hypothetical protein
MNNEGNKQRTSDWPMTVVVLGILGTIVAIIYIVMSGEC